jgi:2-methylcitrate dehydratase PrpD
MGYTGDPTVFDGEYGFWRFYSSESWNPDVVMDQLGKKWLFTDILYKFYPCCSFFATQLDCFRSIIDKNNLMPEDIESVNVLSAPFFASPNPMEVTNQVDAQFSPPYVIAVAAHRVKIGRDWQDFDTIRDKNILGFMKKVNFHVHPGVAEAKRKDPRSWLAKVEVAAKGKIFTEERMYAKGTNGTDFKATDEELVEKFRGNASELLTQDKIDQVIKTLLDLERVENISEIAEQFIL